MTTGDIKYITQRALYDTIGDYLNHYLNPVTKYSYYAGEISYKTTKYLYDLFDYCKKILNTNGIGWRQPINSFKNFTNKIKPIEIEEPKNDEFIDENEQTPCVNLILLGDDINDLEEDMLVSLPKMELDENGDLLSIWLPFKRKHNFNLASKSSAFILLRYFVTVTKCYNFEGNSQEIFNQNFEKWLKESVVPFLYRKSFYPAFGAVLRILETVKTHKTMKEGKTEQIADEFIELNEEVNKVTVTEEPSFFEKLIHPLSKLKDKEESSGHLSREEQVEKNKIMKISVLLIVIVTVIIIIIAAVVKMRRKRKLSTDSLSSSQKSNKSNVKDEEIALSDRSSAIMSNNEGKKLKSRTNILNCSKKRNSSDSSEYSYEPNKLSDTTITIDPIENSVLKTSASIVPVTQDQPGILREPEVQQQRRGIFNKKRNVPSLNFLK